MEQSSQAGAGPLEPTVRQRAPSAHVAWCRYVTKHERPTRIVLCDSDAEGAFPVFRRPHDGEFERWQCKDCGARWGVEITQ